MKNGDQPAFAVSKKMCEVSKIETYPFGLTKREYFAAVAMQGILSSCFASFNPMPEHLAQDALNYADAILSELNKS